MFLASSELEMQALFTNTADRTYDHDDLKHALSAALESHTNEWVEVNDI